MSNVYSLLYLYIRTLLQTQKQMAAEEPGCQKTVNSTVQNQKTVVDVTTKHTLCLYRIKQKQLPTHLSAAQKGGTLPVNKRQSLLLGLL